jgi:hypothetical protein
MSKRVLLSCFLVVLSLTACGDDDKKETTDTGVTPDAGPADTSDVARDTADTGPDGLQRTTPQDGVDPNGYANVDEPASAGEARVGKIMGEETGFTGIWAHCRTGDFKLYNANIEVCIQSETTNRFEVFSGGKLVDAKRVGDDRDEVLDFVMPLVNAGTTYADSVEVIRDGTDGGAAVLQVTSHDIALAHLVGLSGRSLGQPQGLEIVTEYRLEPDSDVVEIVSFYTNPTDGNRSFFVGDWFGFGDRAQLWTPGRGLGAPGGTYNWLASLSEGRSYGWIIPEGEARELGLTQQGLPWAGSRAQRIQLAAGEEGIYQRWFAVGDGTLASIQELSVELRSDEEIAGTRRTLTIETEAGEPAAGRSVLAARDDQSVGWGVTDENGEVTLLLEDGTYDLTIDAWAGAQPYEHTLDVSGETHTVTIETPATLKLDVADADGGEALSARVLIGGGAASWSGPALHGSLELPMAPGTYRVVVMRGPEYDSTAIDVTLTAGETTTESIQLSRAFDTTGWLAGDFHQHMEPSLDSEAGVEARLLENASVGVEVFASTDHEAVTDLNALIATYGLEDAITNLPGVEISPLETHVGLYPMEYKADERGRGTVPLAVVDNAGEPTKRYIPELVDIARGLASDPIVQLNHSRRSSSGMLELVGFDPEVGPDSVDDFRFTTDFDTMEIINRFDNTCRLFADWSGFLNTGHRFTGLGNSDTHGLSGESGLPRNYLHIDKAPGEVTHADVRGAMRTGKVSVGAHTFIDFADDKLPGDTLTIDSGQSLDFPVRVHTPNWAQADHLIAVVNGEVVETFDRSSQAGEHLDFDQTVSITFDDDSWVVFFTYGASPSGEVSSSKPVVGFTNPIYVDVDGDADGDGADWEAPGARALSLEAVNQFCN